VPAKVFESVGELKPLGVGINVLPHAVRELIELGLHDKLDAAGVRTRELAYFSKRGKPIWSEPRGLALLWQIYSRCCFPPICLLQCGHR
jgi:5-methylphenazine-1-carboxylate 1-monooxygenase